MKTLQALRLLQDKTKAEVFLVGGFVRDYMRNKKNDDLDIVVRKLDKDNIISFLKKHGRCKEITLSRTSDAFNTNIILFKAFNDNTEAQISLPRRGQKQIADKNNTLRQDAKYRDFRINSLYLPINFKSKKDVIDVKETKHGLHDIKNREICTDYAAEVLFDMSPVRMMRAVSLAATTGYTVHVSVLEAIKKYKYKIVKAPVEAIRRELDKILLSRKPSKYLRLMQRTGLLGYVIPELEKCVGVSQDTRYHKYDVFTHCIYTCDNSERTLVLRLAGLLHDVGKSDTRKRIKGRVTFHKHEMASVKRARAFLNRFKYDGKTKEAVLNLIRMHMYHYTREYTNQAVRRFIKKAGINKGNINNLRELPLFKLRAAERLGNGLKKDPVTKKQLDFEKRIRGVFEAGGGLEVKDLHINGHILIEAFGLKGEEIGAVLNYLVDRVSRDKRLNNRMDLIQMALQYVKSMEHSKEVLSK
jgi:putative nucleotidyltransferase with HDIG domain